MSHDFFVFPAEQAAELGALTDGGPVAAFLAAVRAVPGVRAAGTDKGAHVATSWDDRMANLRAVAGAARARGLSVLDPQLAALHDPRNAADVALETQGGPRLPFTTRRTLVEVLAHISEGRYHWVSLGRDRGRFAQAYRGDDRWAAMLASSPVTV